MKKSHGSHLRKTATQSSQHLLKRSPSQRQGGYTLLELLVVVMLVGILAAIAAPSWLTFINRQRINAVRGEVYQTLQLAQSDAKKNKLSRTVKFETFSNSKNDVPQVSINGGPLQQLGQGQIKKGQITDIQTYTLTTTGGRTTAIVTTKPITFDYQGNVDQQNGTSAKPPYMVKVSGAGGKRCVIVQTLLGGMKTANGNDCPSP